MGFRGVTFLYHHDRHQITALFTHFLQSITYELLPNPHIGERATATVMAELTSRNTCLTWDHLPPVTTGSLPGLVGESCSAHLGKRVSPVSG